jgi:hypothetical protein
MLAAVGLGIAAGATPLATVRRVTLAGLSSGTVLFFALAAWMVASPSLVKLMDWAVAQPGFISLTSPAWNAAALFALAVTGLGVPAFLAAKLAADGARVREDGPSQTSLVFFGVAAGLAVWGIGLAQIMGPYFCGVAAATLGLAIAIFRSYRSSHTDTLPAEPASSRPARQPMNELPMFVRTPLAGAMAFVLGAWPTAIGSIFEQLMPGTVYVACSEAIGLCLGLAAGLWLAGRRAGAAEFERTRLLLTGAAAAWGVALLAAFPLGIAAGLWVNAYIASPTLLILARGTTAALAVLPVGAIAGLWLASEASIAGARTRLGLVGWLVVAACGSCATSAAALGQFSPEQVIIGLAWLTVAAAAPAAIVARRELSTRWMHRAIAGGVLAAVAVAPMWRGHFDPRRSAKLLFNSNAADARRTGVAAEQLMLLDDGRNVATVTGQRGIYTVWRYGGHQLQIRENGIPRGVVSTDEDVFPRYVPETLQAVFPLVLHEKPERMLLMGLGSSEALSAGLLFPLTDIVCLESDAGLVRVIRETVASDSGMNPLDDERITMAVCDPTVGVAAVPGQFDVIVSSPEHLALGRAQPCLTTEFYARAARKLSADGVFCQRLHFIDFGPRPLRTIVRTMQSAFRDVIVLEAAPGDLLIAATNDERGLIRPGLVARFEYPHVRAVLGQSGIDWTMVLNLGALNREGLGTFMGKLAGAPNSAATGRFPFSMPREVMRWGFKIREVHEALSPSHSRILAWVGKDAESPALVRRLAEVQGQFELMTKLSDQYWAYRGSLRDQVKEKPRSKIQQASASDEPRRLHAEDRRRLRYFKALGQAIHSGRAEDIEHLLEFASPYDPLISYFVHEEAAEIYSRLHERDYARELRLRLYSTFYSSPQDASLRNVVAAMRLLCKQPESQPDPLRRWDELNALLQALKLRWEARSGVRPADVRQAINDIDTTVLAAEQTFEVLERLTVEAGLPPDLWTNRRSVLEQNLIRPVRNYQLQLLPFLHQRKPKSEEALETEVHDAEYSSKGVGE